MYVYGSFLTTDRFNDIDIGILVSGERKPYDLFKYSMLIASRVEQSFQPRCEVDLRILNGAPIRFLYDVIRTGRIVYARDEKERIAFEADVLTTYLDLLPMFEMMDQALIAR
ncbi:nucleotidyltransferase domain-containing protein [Methanocalculus alkaliphilus]|uniref:nucleotidyltransferase domain-containing protein n=1 Tax=Methanocalculus alkaliphilus TaxID=768730 RepID=UPI00209E53B9